MSRLPQTPQPQTPEVAQDRDSFQTPAYASRMIAEYLHPAMRIWECCAGQGRMVQHFRQVGHEVIGSDILYDSAQNVMTYEPDSRWDVAATNVPFSLSKAIVDRFIKLDKPFAFLIAGTWTQWNIKAVWDRGCQLIVPSDRIRYLTPDQLTRIFKGELLRLIVEGEDLSRNIKWSLARDPKGKKKVVAPALVRKYYPQAEAHYAFKTIDEVPDELLERYSSPQFHSVVITRRLCLAEHVIRHVLTPEAMKAIK